MRKWKITAVVGALSLGMIIPAFASTFPNTNFTTGYSSISVPISGSVPFTISDPLHNKSTSSRLTYLPENTPLVHVFVFSYLGKRVKVPSNRPELFIAWWCPHCHQALQQLKKERLLNQFNFVSVWPDEFGKYPVKSLRQVRVKTLDALHSLGISIPPLHLYFTLPTSPVNYEIYETPTFLRKVPKGYLYAQGTPLHAAVWKSYLEANS